MAVGLATSTYRAEAIQTVVVDEVLTVSPLSRGTTLRLGPAEDRQYATAAPLDQAIRVVLSERRFCPGTGSGDVQASRGSTA
ncbi:hypothetical protein AMK21_30270 [Streptomyces sp. CB00316]|nr:hypothetical protein AMK21_30270 [Streptomyces sp. CB00316]